MDDLQLSGLHIIQKPGSFLFGTDSVLLAYFAKTNSKARVLDLGTGNGILPLLLWGRYRPRHICGIEIQSEAASLAERNMIMNGLDGHINIITGDYTKHEMIPDKGRYDVVIANPPYMKDGTGKQSADTQNATARHELSTTLDHVIYAATVSLKHGGKLYIVHKPERMAEIFEAMSRHQIQPKAMQQVQARTDRPPYLILVKGIKQAASGMHLLPALVMYDSNGAYTPHMREIYNGR